ncbi:MAG: hypothetical protein AAF657_25000 [Acidobacteriota bacterium]
MIPIEGAADLEDLPGLKKIIGVEQQSRRRPTEEWSGSEMRVQTAIRASYGPYAIPEG